MKTEQDEYLQSSLEERALKRAKRMAEPYDTFGLLSQNIGETGVGPGVGIWDPSTSTPTSMVPGAFWRQENMIGSYFANETSETGVVDDDFNYLDHLTPDLLPYAPNLSHAKNQTEFDAMIGNIDRQLLDKKVLSDHPWASLGIGLLMSPADPVNYLPGMSLFNEIKVGAGIVKSAINVGASNMAAAALAEVPLSNQQATRTYNESVYNAIGSGIFGSVLGAGGRAIGAAIERKVVNEITNHYAGNANERGAVAAEVDPVTGAYSQQSIDEAGTYNLAPNKYLESNPHEEMFPESFMPRTEEELRAEPASAGAMEVGEQAIIKEAAEEGITGRAGSVIAKASGKFNPILSLSNSPFPTAKKAASELFDMFIAREKNKFDNVGSANPAALSNMVDNMIGRHANTMLKVDDLYYKQAGIEGNLFRKTKDKLAALQGSGVGLKPQEFYPRVASAIRNGFTDSVDEVNKAAMVVHKEILEPTLKEIIRVGILPKNVTTKTAVNYLTRIYNKAQLRQSVNRAKFEGRLKEWYTMTNEELRQMQPVIEGKKKQLKDARRTMNVAIRRDARFKKLTKQLEATGPKSLSQRIKKAESIADPTKAQRENLIYLRKQLKNMKEKIKRARDEMDKVSIDDARERYNELKAEFASEDFVPAHLRDSDGEIREVLDEDQILESVDQSVENVLGDNVERLVGTIGQAGERGRPSVFKNRVLLIPDEMIEEFLINDVREIIDHYSRSVAPAIETAKHGEKIGVVQKKERQIQKVLAQKDELTRKFNASDDVTDDMVNDYTAKIDEYDNKIDELRAPATADDILSHYGDNVKAEYDVLRKGKTAAEQDKLFKQYEQALQDVKFGIESVTYNRKAPSEHSEGFLKFTQALKNWNVARLLGGVVLPSVVDMANIVARHGYGDAMSQAAMVLAKDLPAIENIETINDIGFAINKENSSLMKNLYEVENTYQDPGKILTASQTLADSLFTMSGMNRWQDSMQSIIGSAAISRTLRAIDTWKTTGVMNPKELKRLNALGIDKKHWDVLHKQWQTYGGKTKGRAYYINYGRMDIDGKNTSEAYRSFMSALRNEIKSTIVEPGKGDLPRWMLNPVMSLLTQFKRFNMTTHTKALISNMSMEEANLVSGLGAMLMLGSASYVVQGFLRDGGQTLDLSPANLASEAIDRSGFISLIWGSKNLAQKAFGLGTNTRYNSRGITGMFAGPSFGLLEDVSSLVTKVINSQMRDPMSEKYRALTTKDAKLFLRMLPFQNLFYLSYLNRRLTKEASLALGAEEREGL